jgi:uncharacterized membrane protein
MHKVIIKALISATCGILVGLAGGILFSWKYTPLLTWDIAVGIFLVWTYIQLRGSNAEKTERLATIENPGRAATDVVLIFASIASLAAIGEMLAQASKASGASAFMLTVLCIVSVVISWATVHSVYMLRYAREFYNDKESIDFNSKQPPRYSDFAYLSFTVGMTFQVSDTSIRSNKIRRLILHHSLLSYLFGTVIVAVSINIIAGLVK